MGIHKLIISRGSIANPKFIVTDANNNPVDYSGCTVSCKAKLTLRDPNTKIAVTGSVGGTNNNEITVNFGEDDTNIPAGLYKYSVKVTNGTTIKDYIVTDDLEIIDVVD